MRRRERTRADQLSLRVGWIDRRRRPLAILLALLAAPIMISQCGDIFGADWPRAHAIAMTIVAGFLAWIAIEIGLAWLAALWETEHSQLLRDRGLPRAQLLRRK